MAALNAPDNINPSPNRCSEFRSFMTSGPKTTRIPVNANAEDLVTGQRFFSKQRRDNQRLDINSVARSVVEAQRGKHTTHVFIYNGKPLDRMLNSAWRKARKRVKLPTVRVHDLKHTFGRRLRAAGVSFEDRQDLLGHKSSRMTTHYSAAELWRLIDAANRVCERDGERPELVVLRKFG